MSSGVVRIAMMALLFLECRALPQNRMDLVIALPIPDQTCQGL